MEIRILNKGQTVPSMVNHADCPDGTVRVFHTIIDKIRVQVTNVFPLRIFYVDWKI